MKESVKVLGVAYSNDALLEENLDVIEAAYGVPELREEYMEFYERTLRTFSENIGKGNMVILARGYGEYSSIVITVDKPYNGDLYKFDSGIYNAEGELFIDISPLIL